MVVIGSHLLSWIGYLESIRTGHQNAVGRPTGKRWYCGKKESVGISKRPNWCILGIYAQNGPSSIKEADYPGYTGYRNVPTDWYWKKWRRQKTFGLDKRTEDDEF